MTEASNKLRRLGLAAVFALVTSGVLAEPDRAADDDHRRPIREAEGLAAMAILANVVIQSTRDK